MNNSLFDQVYDIMTRSFPNKEIRSYQGQHNLLSDDYYRLYVKLKNNEVITFLSCWEFDDFSFIEHFATKEDYRGHGIGNDFLLDYIKNKIVLDDNNIVISNNKQTNDKSNIILEVDPPVTDIAKRRIKFYKKLNFSLNPFYYEQPPLGNRKDSFNLKVMSFPNPLNKQLFKSYTDIIKEKVYKYK